MAEFLSEEERKKKLEAYRAEQEARLAHGEQGIEQGSFTEVPGAKALKAKAVQGLTESSVPGAKLAAKAADLMLPENLEEFAPVARGLKALNGMRMAGKESAVADKGTKFVKKDKAFELRDEAGTLKKRSDELRQADIDSPRTLDYSQMKMPERPKAGHGKFSPEQLKKFKKDREELERIKAERAAALAKKPGVAVRD